jgi:hypothetical protein
MTEEVQTTPEAPQWSPVVEEEARALGWKSSEEWAGEKPATYIDNPERFLERAENFGPFKKIKEKLAATEKATEDRLKRIEAVADKAIQRQKEDFDRQLSDLQERKLKAVADGEVDEFKALEERQEALRKQADVPAEKTDAIPADHKAALDKWVVGKPWFKADKIMTQAAVVLYAEAEAEGLTDPGAILARVDAKLAENFPHKFKAAVTEAAVEGGLTFGGAATGDPFGKLPKDARDAFQRFVTKGWFKDDKAGREAYAKDYTDAA